MAFCLAIRADWFSVVQNLKSAVIAEDANKLSTTEIEMIEFRIFITNSSYFIDQKGWSRKKSTLIFGSVITIVGCFCSLSLGGGINITGIFGEDFFLGGTFFDVMDNLSGKYMLPIGGMLTALFVINKMGMKDYIYELSVGSVNQNINPSIIKGFLIVAAAVVAFIIFNEFYALLSGKALVG